MSEIIDKNVSPESAAQHIIAMQKTVGWQILIRYWAEERENILTEGKKSRRDEKIIKMWAVLEGLDRAIGIADRVVAGGKKYEEIQLED